MKKLLKHLFLPHHTNNQRAKILHHSSIFLVAGFLFLQAFVIATIKHQYPQVLGASIDISVQQLLLLTNQKRLDAGIGPLVLNDELTQAAQAKANYMFSRNFWAHNAPDGTTPWAFITNAGYPYIYAGENLARGFTNTQDVMDAWMASPDHRENILSPNYRDVGFAIARGNLTGEQDTVLVVEMFGNTTATPVSEVKNNSPAKNIVEFPNQKLVASAFQSQPLINSKSLTQNASLLLLVFFITTLLIDIIIVKRKNIVRIFEHNIDHILFLGTIAIIVLVLGQGSIF